MSRLCLIVHSYSRLQKQTWSWITGIGKYHLDVDLGVFSKIYFKKTIMRSGAKLFCFFVFFLHIMYVHRLVYNQPYIIVCIRNTTLFSVRSLKLWMVLRLYGVENLQCYIRNHINLAKHFEELVVQDTRFEVIKECCLVFFPNKLFSYSLVAMQIASFIMSEMCASVGPSGVTLASLVFDFFFRSSCVTVNSMGQN